MPSRKPPELKNQRKLDIDRSALGLRLSAVILEKSAGGGITDSGQCSLVTTIGILWAAESGAEIGIPDCGAVFQCHHLASEVGQDRVYLQETIDYIDLLIDIFETNFAIQAHPNLVGKPQAEDGSYFG